jgi:hypothetical protein
MIMKTKFIIALSFLCITARAQYKQQLRGTVMDMILQKPLPGATVTIASLNYATVTDEEGVFRFKDMPIGSYRVLKKQHWKTSLSIPAKKQC